MTSIWKELKRRNVVKVAVAYAIVGWILIEVSSVLGPALNLPEWATSLVAFFVILGFPLALVLSWAYELTPDGMKRSHEVEATESITRVTGRKIDFIIIGLMAVGIGFLLIKVYLPEDSVPKVVVQEEAVEVQSAPDSPTPVALEEQRDALPNSVAVLPFENLSPDQDDAYFATGIHEEILNQIAKLSAINVIARTSVLQYAGVQRPVSEIADELNVETIMEGSVRYADDRVRITTQLIDADTGAHLWSEAYERDFSDIFAIQADVAMNIANALEAEFSLDEQARIEKPPTNSPAAYALYLQALDSFSLGDIAIVHTLLDRAISLDPNFALVYAMNASTYANSFVNTIGSSAVAAAERDELERTIRKDAEKALSLDPSAGLAHAALARIEFFSWRWTDAQRAFERAVQSEGNASSLEYSWLNAYLGRRDEAIQLGRRGVELDPAWWVSHLYLGIAHGYLGEHEAAIDSLSKATDLSPVAPLNHVWLAAMKVARGDPITALDELQIAEQLMGENRRLVILPELAHAYALIDRTEDAQRLFDEITEAAGDRDVGAGAMAQVYLAIGDQASALEWLEVAAQKVENHQVDAGFYNLMQIKMNVLGDPVLEQSEFVAMRSRLTGD